MPEWEIVPFQGLGKLRFGMLRADVRAMLGNDFVAFRKTFDSPNLTDAYDKLGIHLYYDGEDQLEFIETSRRCDPAYKSVHFFGHNPRLVLKELSSLGAEYKKDPDGYDFPKLGFILFIPVGSIEAVSVYRKGYYDVLRG